MDTSPDLCGECERKLVQKTGCFGLHFELWKYFKYPDERDDILAKFKGEEI